MEKLEEKLFVSRETLSELKRYQTILIDWQKNMNLVSNNSLSNAWERHFLDSAQLYQYIPQTAESLIDFGSGAGFPAMVIAVMAKTRTPYLNILMVESIKKKTLFLKQIATDLQLSVQIANERIEKLPPQKVDVITSRAMCSLDKLLQYAKPFCHKDTICIFPKGKSYEIEIEQARLKYEFVCDIKDNMVSPEGKILLISKLKQIKGEKNAKNTRHSKP